MLNAMRALRGFLMQHEGCVPPDVRRYSRRPRRYARPRLESLETRRLLAVTSLPGIMGTVFADANGNDMADPGEGLQGAMVRLFQDDGDGIFEPGADDIQVGPDAFTDANGEYCFDGLDQDTTYFVQQPSQPVAGNDLNEQVSAALQFAPGLIIDAFDTTQSTAALPPPPSDDESSLGFPNEDEVIGAERDLSVQLLSGASEVQLRVNPFGLEDVLLFDSSAGSQGTREITWDGVDSDGGTLALGLGGRDLTDGQTLSGITMRMGVDANGANAILRLYQGDVANFSEVTVPIPVTGGAATEWVFISFDDFSGPVDATNVDAIQLILETGSSSVDGQIDVIGALGAQQADFANPVAIDLELDKSVGVSEVDNGDQVTWTLTLTNNPTSATASATAVVVSDVIPAGLTLISATASDGTFSNDSWALANPLAPGDTATLTLVTTVDSSVAGGTVIDNIAQVTAHNEMDVDSLPDNDDGDQSEDDEDLASITVRDLIDLEITKVADSATANSGDQVTFTITITNNDANANTDATNVEVRDSLPGGTSFVSATPSGNGTFANGVWSLVDPLSPGDSETLMIVAEVDDGIPGDSQLTNVTEVIQADEPDFDSQPDNDDGDQSEDDEASAAFVVGAVIDLEVDKTVNQADVNVGDSVVWTVSVTNNPANANAAATNVQIRDVLPPGVSLQNATPSGNGTFNNDVWSLVDPLQPGTTATLTLTTEVTDGQGGGNLDNTAEVIAADQPDVDSTPDNDDGDQSEDDEDLAQITIRDMIDLEITKVSDTATANSGDQVTFTISIVNNDANANTDATGVQVRDTLPGGTTLVSATPSGNGTFASGVWSLVDPLPPGATQDLVIVAEVSDGIPGESQLTNVAEVIQANEPDVDSQPDNDDGDQSEDDEGSAAFVVGSVIDLEVDKTVNQQNVDLGDTVVWTVTVTNNAANANAAATNVQIRDVLPSGVSLQSATPSGNGTFNNGVWSLVDSLQPGAAATLTLTTDVISGSGGSSLENTAQVIAADQPDVDSAPNNDDGDQSEDDEDADSIQVNPQIDLELTKTVNVTNVDAGQQVTWTVTLTNNQANANADATGVQVEDLLPGGVSLVSASPSIGTFNNGSWALNAPLAPGSSATLGLVTTVNNSVAGGTVLVNTAQVAAANEPDIDSQPNNDDGDQSEDDEANAQITVNEVIDVSIVKSVDRPNVAVGDAVTWTIVVTNDAQNANASASGVTVDDILPAGVTFVTSNTANGSYSNETGVWTLASPLAPGESATLMIVTAVNSEAAGTTQLNVAEVSNHVEMDIDSTPGNDDGDQSEDDEARAQTNVGVVRPISKRDLFASRF